MENFIRLLLLLGMFYMIMPGNRGEVSTQNGNISIYRISDNSVKINWAVANDSTDPYYFNTGYTVILSPLERGNSPKTIMQISTNMETTFTSLESSLHYSVSVYSRWQSRKISTVTKVLQLKNNSAESNETCFTLQNVTRETQENIAMTNWQSNSTCDLWGTIPEKNTSCSCQFPYHGAKCEKCSPGFYRIGQGPCEQCHCDKTVSNENCKLDIYAAIVVCDVCIHNSTGPMCETCPEGFYLAHSYCLPCQCNGSPAHCLPISGQCTQCLNHTVGSHCEFCADARLGKQGAIPPSCEVPSNVSRGAIIFLVLILLALGVSFILWILLRHRREARKRRAHALWTVEYDTAMNDYFDASQPDAGSNGVSGPGHLQLKSPDEDQDNVYHSKVYA